MRAPGFGVPLAAVALMGSLATPALPAQGQKVPKVLTESLLSVVTPEHKGVALAHPWVNVEVELGATSDEVPANPATFRAKLGGCDITDLFEDFQHGTAMGKRARLPRDLGGRCRLKTGPRSKNRLKFKIRAQTSGAKGRRRADLDRVRFGVVETDNRVPVADFTSDPPAIGSTCADGSSGGTGQGIEVSFSATATDPDGDRLRYEWDFGDGGSGSGPDVAHHYATQDPVVVSLRVSDGEADQGGLETTIQRSLQSPLAVDGGRTPGALRLSTDPPTTVLDFGAVPIGSSRQVRLRVHNDDPPGAATSQVKVAVNVVGELSSGGSQFTVEDCTPLAPCSIDAAGTADVALTFAPQGAGHAHAVLQLEAAASNRCSVQLLIHGYGGPGPGIPWGTPDTVFGLAGELLAVTPAGITVFLGAGTGICQGGSLDGAPCIADGDCPGAGCSARVCLGGSNDGNVCGAFFDCPGGFCGDPFDALDMCADGTGSVFLLNDELHDDPSRNCDECDETGTILEIAIDGHQSIVTQKVTFESLALACDRLADGRVFWTHHDIFGVQFEDREQLRSVKKSGTGPQTHLQNISQRLGDVDPLNYIDPTDGFIYYEPSLAARVSPDGSQRFVSNTFGLYRADPPPALLITREVEEVFDVGIDGAVLAALSDARTGEIRVYKVSPSIAVNGAVTLSLLAPWATARMPSNVLCTTEACSRTTFITNVAGDSAGNVFVNLLTGMDSGANGVVPRNLRPQGTLRFEPQGDGSQGVSRGFVSLLLLDRLDL